VGRATPGASVLRVWGHQFSWCWGEVSTCSSHIAGRLRQSAVPGPGPCFRLACYEYCYCRMLAGVMSWEGARVSGNSSGPIAAAFDHSLIVRSCTCAGQGQLIHGLHVHQAQQGPPPPHPTHASASNNLVCVSVDVFGRSEPPPPFVVADTKDKRFRISVKGWDVLSPQAICTHAGEACMHLQCRAQHVHSEQRFQTPCPGMPNSTK
jgi:hypothetical protein